MKKRDATDVAQLNHKPGPVRERYSLLGLLLALGALISPMATGAEQCAAGPGTETRDVVARYGKSVHFDVYRNDKPVGRHDAVFSEENGFLVIRSTLDLGIKLLFIEAYHYRYEAAEYWCNNALVRLEATVNDDGKLSRVAARNEDGRLKLTAAEGGSGSAPLGSFATNHWHPGVLHTAAVINTLTGHLNKVALVPCKAPAPDGSPVAQCMDYTGDLKARVWYDDTGRWRGLAFAGTDGSAIDYRLQSAVPAQAARTDP